MRKNKMMRLASALLVAVLLTTSVISGTYAKYVTEGSAQDSARVAKWGVLFDLEGGPLFSPEYATEDTDYTTSMDLSVKSSVGDNVVAPGTEGELVSFRTIGTPEVSYEVSFEVNNIETIFTNKRITLDANRNASSATISNGYYPISFLITLGDDTHTRIDIEDVEDLIEDFKYYFDVTDGKYYVVGDSTHTPYDNCPKVSVTWAWDFEDGTTETDLNDTTLGNIAAGVSEVVAVAGEDGTDYNLEVKLGLTATATQID